MLEAPKKKGAGAVVLVAVIAALAFLLLGGKKAAPPGPQPILRSVGEPDISPVGAINQGEVKTITWQCQNTGTASGLAVLRVDRVSPNPTTGLLLGENVTIPVGQTIPLVLTKPYNLPPGDYVMKVVMVDATTTARPVVATRNFPLTIAVLVPKPILTAGTLVIT